MTELQEEKRRGYLHEDYRLFRLRDRIPPEVEYHYHDFHKLMFLYSGDVKYVVEGRECAMEPGDFVTVPRGALHRPIVGQGGEYDRCILYLSPEFLRRESTVECDLELCFSEQFLQSGHVLRPAESEAGKIAAILKNAQQAAFDGERYGSALLCRTILMQLLICLARAGREKKLLSPGTEPRNEKNAELLRYIGENLAEDLSVEALSRRFFISRYHLMHRFRQENGVTLHGYILAKRLMLARDLIASGTPATEACFACGCRDYSAFARAYKKQFGVSPRGKLSGGMEGIRQE